jgi:serine phosphatase RsbU (regulator of sigma subunit)
VERLLEGTHGIAEATEPRSRILVVDDFPTGRRLLAHKLGETYSVITAESGEDALRLAASHKPDIILLDVEMPGLDGFGTLEILRRGVIDEAVPVIFVTARNDKESRNRGLAAGAVDFLTKPYDKEELLIKVGNHLALYQARKQIDRANRKMAEELKMASDLQRSLLPAEFPSSDRVTFCAVFLPASQASGDLYDVVRLPGGQVAFVQVDVAGHGVRSAMIGAMFKMGFQAISKTYFSPSSFLVGLNDDLTAVTPDTDYLTAFCGIIDSDSLTLVYSNAGHPRPFLYRQGSRDVRELTEGGMMVGAYPGIDYDEGTETLQSGDRILAFTDGVTEAPHRDEGVKQLYGKARLKDLFIKNISRDPQDILDEIIADVMEFQGSSSFHDDVSLLLVSIR